MRIPSRDVLLVLALSSLAFAAIFALILHRAQILNEPLIIITGGQGRPYHKLALRYKDFLERNGVDVEVHTSHGSIENLEALHDTASKVKVGFIQGGVTTPEMSAALLSMGRVLTEPVWIFHECAKTQSPPTLKDLQGKRILVGGQGSGTRYLATLLLQDHGVNERNATWIPRDAKQFLEKPTAADAGFLVVAVDLRDADPANPQDIKQLTRKKCLANMTLADGLTQRFPFLSQVILHKGAFDMRETLPAEDVTLLASKAALVVRKDVDPALQNLLAQAVLEVQSSPGRDAKFFPLSRASLIEDDPEFALSTEAGRVYRSDQTFFQRLLPFWIATFLDDVILYILALPFVTILVQFFRVVPLTRDFIIRRRRDNVHSELNELDRRLGLSTSPETVDNAEAEITQIAKRVSSMPLPENDRFNLSRHIDLIRRSINSARQQNEA
jgi:uncharacterized protein